MFEETILLYQKTNTSGSLNRGTVANLTLLRKLLAISQKSREPSFREVMDSFVLLAYASLAASRNLLTQFRRFIVMIQMKKVISMNYGSSTSG